MESDTFYQCEKWVKEKGIEDGDGDRETNGT